MVNDPSTVTEELCAGVTLEWSNVPGGFEFTAFYQDNPIHSVEENRKILKSDQKQRQFINGVVDTLESQNGVDADAVETELRSFFADLAKREEESTETTVGGTSSQGSWTANATRNNDTIIAVYNDNAEITDRVEITVHERNNRSNQLTGSDTYIDRDEIDTMYQLQTQEQLDTEWVVRFEIERDGQSYDITRVTSVNFSGTIPGLGKTWRTIFAVATLFMLAGVFSVLNKAAGGIALGVVGGLLFWLGWLSGATVGMSIVLYLFIAVLYALYTRRP